MCVFVVRMGMMLFDGYDGKILFLTSEGGNYAAVPTIPSHPSAGSYTTSDKNNVTLIGGNPPPRLRRPSPDIPLREVPVSALKQKTLNGARNSADLVLP